MTFSPAACPIGRYYKYHPNFNGFDGYQTYINVTSSALQIETSPIGNPAKLITNSITNNKNSEYIITTQLNYLALTSLSGTEGVLLFANNTGTPNCYGIGFKDPSRTGSVPNGTLGAIRYESGTHYIDSGTYYAALPNNITLNCKISCTPTGVSGHYNITASGVFVNTATQATIHTVNPYTWNDKTLTSVCYGVQMSSRNIIVTLDRLVSEDVIGSACRGNIYSDFSFSGAASV